VWVTVVALQILLQGEISRTFAQRWPESLFQTPTLLLFQNFGIRVPIMQFFKFENPTTVQTPATIINPTLIFPCFCLIDSCYCWNWKVTPDPGVIFPKFLTPDPDPKEKRRILPQATPVIWIRSHLCFRKPYLRLDARFVKKLSNCQGVRDGTVRDFSGPVSSEISDLRNFLLQTMYTCTE